MKHLRRLFFCCLFIFFIGQYFNPAYSQDCGCTYTVPFNSHVDGAVLNIKPGDVICLQAITYGNIRFRNIHGTEAKPVIIKNCGGQAFINSTGGYGVKFEYSSHYKFLGNGDPGVQYGIKITSINGFYLTHEEFSTNMEIAFIEIAGATPGDLHSPLAGFAGIGVKTKPHCDGTSNRGVWTMYNPIIHDNYIHDTGGEGMYIGHGFYKGRIETGCTDTTYSHSIVGLRVYNNLIENTGYDGLQIKNADVDCEIYNNVIRNFGQNGEGAHNEGLFMGEGVTGKAYNNWIQNGTGHGIQFQGIGNNEIFNNVVIGAGGNGMYAAHGPYVVRKPGQPFHIFNNTFINCGQDGFVFFHTDGGPKRVFNNIFANVKGTFINAANNIEHSNNFTTNDLSRINFTDPTNLDLHLLPTSPLIDAGLDLTPYGGLSFDHDGASRPYNGAYDIGAYEFGSIPNLLPSVTITSPATGSSFVAGNDILLQADASDADGTIAKVEFFYGLVKIGEALTAPYEYAWTTVPGGVYTVIARATDDLGAVRSSIPVIITVTNELPVVTITAPIDGTTFSTGSDITISVDATDPDGTITLVEFFRNSTKIGDDVSGPFSLTWNNVPTGTYNIIVRATDNAGGVTISSPINIVVANHPPVVAITSPAAASSFPAGTAVALQATASDADGTIAKVEFYYGTIKIGEDITSPYTFNWTNAPVGVHSVTARATDNSGIVTVSAPISITITNILPVVAITSPSNGATFSAGTNITINATASDADGAVTKVEFFYGTTKIGETSISPYSIVWSNVAAGTYSLIARATDNSGAVRSSSAVTITVTNIPPTVSITSPANDATFNSGSVIVINATANDADGTIAKVEFFLGAAKIGESLIAPYSLSYTANLASGTYNIIARATDNAGSVTSSSPVRIRIANIAPVVSITFPADQTTYTANSDILFEATATDADGTIIKVEFYNGSVKLGEDLAGPYSFLWGSVPQGTYSITARAIDNAGGVKVSAPVTVIVNNTSNLPPVVSVTAPADGAFYNAGADVTINAIASDPDGTIVLVEFYQGGVKLGEIADAPYSFTWTSLAEGNYTITVVAIDNFGETTTSQPVNISVGNLPPVVAITAPSDNDVFSGGSDISITVAATDPDGAVVKVEYYSGAVKLGESTNAPYSFNWENVPVGTYSITAVATDNTGAATTSQPISISVVNNAPSISITAPPDGSSIPEGSSLLITTNVNDSDGSVVLVEFFQGNVKIGEAVTAPFSFEVGVLPVGTYNFTAVATDNAGESTISSPVSITIVNEPPTVSIVFPSDNSTFNAGSDITFVAEASDSDGNIVKVEFYEGGIKIGESLGSPYSFIWAGVLPGSYSITAIATDNGGSVTSSQPVSITVANYLPEVALTSPAANTTFNSGVNITLTATASDPDGSIVKVEFYQGNIKIGEATASPYEFVWASTTPGTYPLIAIAIDNEGGKDTSEVVTVTIIPANQIPVVSITSPLHNAELSPCSGVTIQANAQDSDGTITKVAFLLDDVVIGEDLTPPYSYRINDLQEGSYQLSTVAYDNSGAENSSSVINVTVGSDLLASFTAVAGPDLVVSDGNRTITVNTGEVIEVINTTDRATYDLVSWNWNFNDNSTSNHWDTSHIYLEPGIYLVQLSIQDNFGCSSTADVRVIVDDTIQPEVFVPKAFSPVERNQENASCKVYGKISSQDFVFQIFSRWGKVVYETDSFDEANLFGWNGASASPGTYTYVVKGKYLNGGMFEKAGTVTLIK